MPRGKPSNTPKIVKRPRKEASRDAFENSDTAVSEDSIEINNSPANSGSPKDKIEENESDNLQDFSGEMSNLLQKFNSDMNKTIQAKRRKLEQFTQYNSGEKQEQERVYHILHYESTRTTTKKVLETNKNQSSERRNLIEHFRDQFFTLIQQGENELEKIKEAEDRLQKLLVQQQKHQQQVRIAHSHRIKALKSLSEEFCKGMNDLEESHVEQYSAVHNELRKEMALLQKKILMETQQQEMMNVRKHLKQMVT